MQRVIVNGANGYVASHFVSELLNNGYQVVAFVRATSKATSEQRLKNVLAEIDSQTNFSNLKVFDYNLGVHRPTNTL